MIEEIGNNIISPLGMTTEENYLNVKAGRSLLQKHTGIWELPKPFTASLLAREQWESLGDDPRYTRFERLVIASVTQAAAEANLSLDSPKVLLILSTTKGNIELLDSRSSPPRGRTAAEAVSLGDCARVIAECLHYPGQPIVVSNACISGLCAQIAAKRALESGHFDFAVVCGADVQSRFIISGFQSFKALSPEECKPFDKERKGLNLGEAAATVIYQRCETPTNPAHWYAIRGAVRNDANHISGPSRTGEGSYRALRYVLENRERQAFNPGHLAFINVHGTSTNYNDEMESIAIDRAGLLQVPLNALKGYYGHTMGAAGVLETVLSMQALDDHTILGTRGFSHLGVSRQVNISGQNRNTNKRAFIKLLSGFGGSNAAMLFQKGGEE